jgi:hypothetical protein
VAVVGKRGRLAVVAAVVAMGSALFGQRVAASGADRPVHVLLMGDSLAWEAEQDFVFDATLSQRAAVDTMAFGGTALCDWLPRLDAELASFHPQAAVVEFSGNAFTPCMHDPITHQPYSGPALVAKYASDAEQAMRIFKAHGVTVFWASAPAFRNGSPTPGELNDVWQVIAATWSDARYVDAGQAVLDHGHYTDYLPCLPTEPCTYVNPATGQPAARVRAPDGIHFCPTGATATQGMTASCRVWSSGAWRYGAALLAPVAAVYRI